MRLILSSSPFNIYNFFWRTFNIYNYSHTRISYINVCYIREAHISPDSLRQSVSSRAVVVALLLLQYHICASLTCQTFTESHSLFPVSHPHCFLLPKVESFSYPELPWIRSSNLRGWYAFSLAVLYLTSFLFFLQVGLDFAWFFDFLFSTDFLVALDLICMLSHCLFFWTLPCFYTSTCIYAMMIGFELWWVAFRFSAYPFDGFSCKTWCLVCLDIMIIALTIWVNWVY